MLNHVILGIDIVLLAAMIALRTEINQERADFDDTAPRWQSFLVRYTGPLSKLGRRLWWIRAACIGLAFGTVFLL